MCTQPFVQAQIKEDIEAPRHCPYSEPVVIQCKLVAIQCCWNLDPSVHGNATGERIVGSQFVSSMFPVVSQCVTIMQINTELSLGYHWVLASASVVPVASQCTCGSSGLGAGGGGEGICMGIQESAAEYIYWRSSNDNISTLPLLWRCTYISEHRLVWPMRRVHCIAIWSTFGISRF